MNEQIKNTHTHTHNDAILKVAIGEWETGKGGEYISKNGAYKRASNLGRGDRSVQRFEHGEDWKGMTKWQFLLWQLYFK